VPHYAKAHLLGMTSYVTTQACGRSLCKHRKGRHISINCCSHSTMVPDMYITWNSDHMGPAQEKGAPEAPPK